MQITAVMIEKGMMRWKVIQTSSLKPNEILLNRNAIIISIPRVIMII